MSATVLKLKLPGFGAPEDRLRLLEYAVNHLKCCPTSGGGGGTATGVFGETPTGSGTSFTLAATPILASEALYYNGLRLRRVGASPGLYSYTITGTSITTGFTVQSGDILLADYQTSVSTSVIGYEPLDARPTATVTFGAVPAAGSDRLYYNGQRCRRVGSSPGILAYTLAGAVATLGFTVQVGDVVQMDYST